MTSREALLKGGDTDAALVPGKRAESFLFELLAAEGDPHMPPKKQLSAGEIEAIGQWIDEGAKWDAALLAKIRLEPDAEVKIGVLPQNYRPVLDLAASPDERFLAMARGDRVEVYDLSSEEPVRVANLTGHRDAVQSLAWSADGKALASGGFRQIRIWDAGIWDLAANLEGEITGRVTSLAFMGESLVSADSIPASPGKSPNLAAGGLEARPHDRSSRRQRFRHRREPGRKAAGDGQRRQTCPPLGPENLETRPCSGRAHRLRFDRRIQPAK